MTAPAAALPRTLRAAATARRVLGRRGTRAVYGSTFAAPLRRLLTSSAPQGFSLVEICAGQLRGVRMHIDLACEKYYWLGTHEEAVQAALCEQTLPGSVTYDVGAHAGFFSLLLSRLTGQGGRVLAFEPQPANAARLLANLAANRCDNVEVHAAALSDRRGTLPFVAHASSLQGALGAGEAAEGAGVATTTIDDVVRDGAPPPKLMKIDVEGAEGRVLAGARGTVALYRPAMLLEVHSPAAWGEVLDALPIPYAFSDIEATAYSPALRMPGHYLGVAADR
jgi:FkbM family methyltransferase